MGPFVPFRSDRSLDSYNGAKQDLFGLGLCRPRKRETYTHTSLISISMLLPLNSLGTVFSLPHCYVPCYFDSAHSYISYLIAYVRASCDYVSRPIVAAESVLLVREGGLYWNSKFACGQFLGRIPRMTFKELPVFHIFYELKRKTTQKKRLFKICLILL